jgi:hypothetical protein
MNLIPMKKRPIPPMRPNISSCVAIDIPLSR